MFTSVHGLVKCTFKCLAVVIYGMVGWYDAVYVEACDCNNCYRKSLLVLLLSFLQKYCKLLVQ